MPGTRPDLRWLFWLIAAALAFFAIVIALVVLFFFAIFGAVRGSEGHICARYYVQHDATAQRIAGTPMADYGFPSASASSEGGVMRYHESFTLRGPRADVAVEAQGVKSPFESHLSVRMASNGTVATVYDGPFACKARR